MFDIDRDYFELLIESGTNLKIWYKERDQFGGLLSKIYITWEQILQDTKLNKIYLGAHT